MTDAATHAAASEADHLRTVAQRVLAMAQPGEALEVVGAVLADAPDHADALWLYGELVVRRKLGITEYDWPEVDWSVLTRGAAGS